MELLLYRTVKVALKHGMSSEHRWDISVSGFVAEALGPVKYIGVPFGSHIAYFLFWLNICLSLLTLINLAVIFGAQHRALTRTTPISSLKWIRVFLISTYIFVLLQAVRLFFLCQHKE
ncbi:unnamed protein product [Gongylonema pulchrum]|uniref:Ion_trans domain-containing protein n=1 Tax=Gongylonema pulchrum TaxID=637853 RepID=A0A183EJW7_9BILA|nr:unnamed protein product [Gongylonema pulchrum]